MRMLLMEEAMSQSRQIAEAISDALPPRADARDELIALGLVATGVICQTPVDRRAQLVDTFCALLRKGCAADLN